MDEHIVFGRNAVEEALRASGRVNRLLVAKGARPEWLDALLDQARAAKVRFDFVPPAKLARLAHSHDHQGVVAVVSPVEHLSLEQCLAECPTQAALLALDGVQNPRNVGMLLRTALGAGVSGVLLPVRGGALLSEEIVRASAGAVLRVPVVYCGNLPQALRTLREAGFWSYGLAAQGERDVFDISWPDRAVLVVGNETEGLRPVVRKACDTLVRVPLAGELESLNVVVAAGIALFQIAAQRRLDGEVATR
jgi:23S rRNA (guanosine2251-2'-O)-methyltransferase